MLDLFGRARLKLGRPHSGTDARHPGWPEATPAVRLHDGARLYLRPLLRSDGPDWRRMRISDERFLRPVEPTQPGGWAQAHTAQAWWSYFLSLRDAAQSGTLIPFAIERDGNFVGQVTLGSIQHGGIGDCWIGYWVHSSVTGRGVASAACALGTDHAFRRVGLHRVTATYLPDNPASGAVLTSAGFREEGYLHRNLHINGSWQDHYFMAQVIDDHPEACVSMLRKSGRIR